MSSLPYQDEIKKVVLCYSGGLDTSCMLKWLQENYHCSVVSFTADLGQELGERDSFTAIEEKAYNLGVEKHYTMDLRDEFVNDYIVPCIKANGLYQGVYPLSTSLARPLIAKYAVQVAEEVGADAIAHGCTGKGNDQVRFNITIQALNPSMKIIQPVIWWGMSRPEEVEYAKENGIPISNANKTYSTDENLFGRSIECGPLEVPENICEESAYQWTTAPDETPNEPEIVQIDFEKGVPCGVNDEVMSTRGVIEAIHKIAAAHGVGRLDHMEDRAVGLKSRETYENPAAIPIIMAHHDLEKYVSTKHENSFKTMVDQKWTELVYEGLWVEPLRDDLEAFINSMNQNVTGWVKLRMFKGSCRPVARSSPNALYDLNLATYTKESTFDEKSSEGFIKIFGLQSRMAYRLKHAKD
jgi:argininosuccinate synthase